MDKSRAGHLAVDDRERFPWTRVLRTGAQWKGLPGRCPPHQTCRRRLQQWTKAGVLQGFALSRELAADVQNQNKAAVYEAFIDGSFVPALQALRRMK